MRILSLLPAATEIVYLLGLEKYLVGVSHECDFPAEVKGKLKVTSADISNAMSSKEIDQRVKKVGHSGRGVFHIKEGVLKKLRPDLILTQELCEVCALGFTAVRKAARILEGEVKIISLEPQSVEDILKNIMLIGEATGSRQQARKVVRGLRNRIRNLKLEVRNSTKPKVCVIEWLDPIMVAGHWVPQMVEIAGGDNLLAKRGEQSKAVKIDQIKSVKVDILIISPCGFDIKRIIKEEKLVVDIMKQVKHTGSKAYLMDGASFMTRPGPRIVDGAEILAEILHPEIFKRKHAEKDWRSL